MTPEEARQADSYSDPPAIPEDTKVYIAPGQADDDLVKGCHQRLAEAPGDELCRLYLLHAEGKARDGAYSASEAQGALEEADAEEAEKGAGQ